VTLVRLVLVVTLAMFAVTAPAQGSPPGDHDVGDEVLGGGGGEGPPPRPPAFIDQLFPPKLVMEHQQELELGEAQIEAIKKAMIDAQQQLVDLQWKLDAKTEAMSKLLSRDKVDETAVVEQLKELSAVEQAVKTLNFILLVRIKNQLDATQQTKLRTFRRERDPHRGPPPPPPPQGMGERRGPWGDS